jgi:RimJ/RimL family protein N-acetyltransferase
MARADRNSSSWLATDRLWLREFVSWDYPHLVEMHRDERMNRLLLDRQPFEESSYSLAFIERMLEIYQEYPGLGIWAAERMKLPIAAAELETAEVREVLSDEALVRLSQARPEFIGWFNLMPVPHDLEEIEIGSRLIPAVWGGGYAVEGGDLLLSHAFEKLGRESVWAFTQSDHRAAQFVLFRLGFEAAGEVLYDGKPAQSFRVTESQWSRCCDQSATARKRAALRKFKINSESDPGWCSQQVLG